jgi:TIR domain
MTDGVTSETTEGAYFLSYSRSDEKFALRLAKDLRAAGVAMWVDQLDIRPSEHWDKAIERAVTSCRGLVVILSPRSVASDNVADEISYAIDSGKSVLPVKIEACTLPLRLTRKQIVDATGNYERALQQCLDELLRIDDPHVAPARPAPIPLDAHAIGIAKLQLAPILGPIAARLVDKEAARAGSIPELYAQLSQHIDADAERERFIALAPKGAHSAAEPKPERRPAEQVAQTALPAAELESMTRLMTQYIGPIASVVVKRESKAAASIKELRHQLAEKIPHQRDRAEFLRLSGG